MLLMKLKIGFRDMDGVGHVVVDSCSRQPMRAGPVLLGPADRGVDRHIRNWIPCGISSLAMLCASPDLA